MQKPYIIGLDFDGTVADSIPQCYRAMCGVFNDQHIAPPSYRDYVGNFHFGVVENFYVSRGVKIGMDAVNRAFDRNFLSQIQAKPVAFFPDTVGTFERLGELGITYGILSAQFQHVVVGCFAGCSEEIRKSIRFILVKVRNKAKMLAEVRTEVGADGMGCWYVGDFVSDMTAAKEAGYTAIGITRGFSSAETLRSAGADYCVSDLSELLALVATCK